MDIDEKERELEEIILQSNSSKVLRRFSDSGDAAQLSMDLEERLVVPARITLGKSTWNREEEICSLVEAGLRVIHACIHHCHITLRKTIVEKLRRNWVLAKLFPVIKGKFYLVWNKLIFFSL